MLFSSATGGMFPRKIDWFKKATWPWRWLSPLLMVSLAFHGLAMLIPLSEKERIVEKPEEVALPEPIAVTTLPKSAAANLPAAPVLIDPADPALSDAALPALPIPGQAITPSPEPTPAPIPLSPLAQPSPAATQPPVIPSATPPPTNLSITEQSYNSSGATDNDQTINTLQFSVTYGAPKKINPVLELMYSANCFDIDKDTNIEASVGVVVDDLGAFAVTELLKTTGYSEIDDWLTDYILLREPLPDAAFTQLQETIPTAPASGDLLDWLNVARNSSDPLVATGQSQAPYAFRIVVEGNQCKLP